MRHCAIAIDGSLHGALRTVSYAYWTSSVREHKLSSKSLITQIK